MGPLWPAVIQPGDAGYLDFGTSSGCGPGQQVIFTSVWFRLADGGTISSTESVTIGDCGLTMSTFGLRPPAVTPATPEPGSASRLRARVEVPAMIKRGQLLIYSVVLTNPTQSDVLLSPCPSYTEWIGYPTNERRSYWLDCDGGNLIPAGANVTFEMRMFVPQGATPGLNKFSWQLNDPFGPYSGSSISVGA